MSAFDPKRTSHVSRSSPSRALVLIATIACLSLGGGNETAQQNGWKRGKNTTSQGVEASQCAKGCTTSQLFRCRSAKADQCPCRRTERGVGATDGHLRSAEGHLKFVGRTRACVRILAGKRQTSLRRRFRRHFSPRRRWVSPRGLARRDGRIHQSQMARAIYSARR